MIVQFREYPYADAAQYWMSEWHSTELFSWQPEPHPHCKVQNLDPMRGECKYKWPKYLLKQRLQDWVVYIHTGGEVVEAASYGQRERCYSFCNGWEKSDVMAEVIDPIIDEIILEEQEQERRNDSR